jgi:hypothetical protein
MFLDSGFCVIVSTVPNRQAVIIRRFFSGVLSVIPVIMVAGSIEDMYGSEKRVWMIFVSGLAANIGLTI